jgi:uncharacterized membrane-anchored protein
MIGLSLSGVRLAGSLIAIAGAGFIAWRTLQGHGTDQDGLLTTIERFAAGWCAMALLGLMIGSGHTFLLGNTMFGGAYAGATEITGYTFSLVNGGLSLTLALLAYAWLSARNNAFNSLPGYGISTVAAILAALMSGLGGAIAILAVAFTAGRRALAGLAAFACLWIIGAFYYWLGWPLDQKAYLLIGMGAALGFACWIFGLKPAIFASMPQPHSAIKPGLAAVLIAVSTAATAGIVGSGILEKERAIDSGRKVYIELVPVDPRSLMQGDYMALRFKLPDTVETRRGVVRSAGGTKPRASAHVDDRDIATIHTVTTTPVTAAANEVVINLIAKRGGWIVGTDAFFFREGTGQVYAKAKYGEFRVTAAGMAILVGLADADLKPLK